MPSVLMQGQSKGRDVPAARYPISLTKWTACHGDVREGGLAGPLFDAFPLPALGGGRGGTSERSSVVAGLDRRSFPAGTDVRLVRRTLRSGVRAHVAALPGV